MSKKKGTNATIAVRQQAALEYRVSGFTYRQIAAQLGVSEKTAYYDVQGSIDNIEAIKSEKAEQIREMELIRLDRMLGLDAAIQVKQEIAANDGKPFVFTMQFNHDADLNK
jgi:FixJ family two-component response regulator